MNFRKNSKGITLVALVVTIIILLILAGVSLSLVSGGNGILDKATKAVYYTTKGSAKEELELYLAECKANCYEEIYLNGKNISLLNIIQKDIGENNEKEAKNGKIVLNKNKLEYIINGEKVAEVLIEDLGKNTDISVIPSKVAVTVNVVSEDNLITDFVGKKITIKNVEDDTDVQNYTLQSGEKGYTFENLEIGKKYEVTIDEYTSNNYEFSKPYEEIIISDNNVVELNYEIQKMYLYNGSLGNSELNKCTDITGGWDFSRLHEAGDVTTFNSTYSFNSDNMEIKQYGVNDNQYVTILSTRDTINFSNYTNMIIETYIDTYNYIYPNHVGIIVTNNSNDVSLFSSDYTGNKTFVCDVSLNNKNEKMVLKTLTHGVDKYHVFLNIYKIYLEK